MANTHYDLLGVASSASPELIQSAYELEMRKIAEASPGDRESAMAAVRRAYAILSDTSLRESYDAELAQARRARTGASIYSAPASSSGSAASEGVAAMATAAFEAGDYGGFWARVGAAVVDGMILYIPCGVVGVALAAGFSAAGNPNAGAIAAILGYVGTILLYHGFLNSRTRRATWGRSLLGLAVVDASSGEKIGFGRGIWRALVSILTGWPLFTALIQLITARRQSLSDLLAGTVVVRRSTSGGAAIVLVVVLVVFGGIALIGILAAIALPAYQDYTVRAKITQGLLQADAAKAIVAENFAAGHDPSAAALSRDYQFVPSKYVSSIEIGDGGVIAITYNAQAILPAIGKDNILTLQANINGHPLIRGVQGQIIWACASQSYTYAASQRLTVAPWATLRPAFAPANCR